MADKADIANDYIEWRLNQVLAARGHIAGARNMVGCAECLDCGEEIPDARRERMPGVTTCVPCQTQREARR